MKPIRWGILGTGTIAHQFAQGLQQADGAVLQAVASRTRERAEEFAKRYSATTAYADYTALVNDANVDVVYIATPNERHREDALLAITAGKAVLCEKPFALTAAEGRQVLEAARQRGVFCMEAMWMRCSPALNTALQQVRAGAIGEVHLLQAQLGFAKVPDAASSLFQPASGGALLDLGVYPLALAQAVFGTPATVSAVLDKGRTGVDETVSILLGYPGGQQAQIATSLRCQLNNSASLHGLGGILRIEDPLYFPESFRLQPIAPSGPVTAPPSARRLQHHPAVRPLMAAARRLRETLRSPRQTQYPVGTGYTAEANEVMRCLRAGETASTLVPQADTLAVLETMDRIRACWTVNR